jgi:hypothetical protein
MAGLDPAIYSSTVTPRMPGSIPGSSPGTGMTTREDAMATRRQLHLGAFMCPTTIHTAARRYPGAWPDANFNLAHLKRFIQGDRGGSRPSESHYSGIRFEAELLSAICSHGAAEAPFS